MTIAFLLLCSCKESGNASFSSDETGDTLEMRYARNIKLIQYKDSFVAILRNPWDTTKTLNRYAITKPLKKAAVFTSVLCSLMEELGVESSIGGVTEVEYIGVDYVLKGVKEGRIADLGNSMEPNLERIMELEPDALMPSPFQDSGGYGRLERLGIPIIECADYMEVSPLARAEWMRFYGRLFGVGDKADSLFLAVEKEYLSLKEKAEAVEKRPTLLAESLSGASWYTPGGNSTMGILYKDAGADYIWKDTKESGSLPLSIERVLEKGLDADVWIMKYNADDTLSYREFSEENAAYSRFKAFQNHHVYGCNLMASRFYEETPYHPERLLENLLQIFHPELSISPKKLYFCPLKD